MLKKLFEINYKSKKILILIDENHRKTFLEVCPDGNLVKLDKNIFLELDKIYNYKDKDVVFEIKNLPLKRTLISAMLALGLSTFSSSALAKIPESSEIETVTYSDDYTNSVNTDYYDNLETFKEMYGYDDRKITREDVVRAINNNSNLNEKYKRLAIRQLDNFLNDDPEMDLCIYYHNIRDVVVYEMSYDDIVAMWNMSIAGLYNFYSNFIVVNEDAVDNVFLHELVHTARCYRDNYVCISDHYGSFLQEADADRLSNSDAYYIEGVIERYFLENIDNFTSHDFNEQGAYVIINKLKEKYPNVDIDYLIDFFDANMITCQNFGENIVLINEDMALNELFGIAISNVDKTNIYKSYSLFRKMVDEATLFDRIFGKCTYDDVNMLNYDYFLRYNTELLKLGYIDENNLDLLRNCNIIVYDNGRFYFGVNDYYYDYDGNKKMIDDTDSKYEFNNFEFILNYMDDIISGKMIYSKEYMMKCIETELPDTEELREYKAMALNEELIKKGINEKEFDLLCNCNHVVYNDGEFYFGVGEYYYDYDENKKEIDEENMLVFNFNNMAFWSNNVVSGKPVYAKEYLMKYIKNEKLFDSNSNRILIEKFNYSSYENADERILKFMDSLFEYIIGEDDITVENMQRALNKYIDYGAKVYYGRYRGLPYTNYIGHYEFADECFDKCCKLLIDAGIFKEENIQLLKQIRNVIEINGEYYPCSKVNCEDCASSFDMNSGEYLLHTIGIKTEPMTFEYFDNNYELSIKSINNCIVRKSDISFDSMFKLFESFGNSDLLQFKLNEVLKNNDILLEHFYDNLELNGETITLDNNMFIQFGKDLNGDITYQITNNDNVIYSSVENFMALSSKIKYKDFLYCKGGRNTMFYSQYEIICALDILSVCEKNISVDDKMIEFIEPIVSVIDGKEYYARDVYVRYDSDMKSVFLFLPNGLFYKVRELGEEGELSLKLSNHNYSNYIWTHDPETSETHYKYSYNLEFFIKQFGIELNDNKCYLSINQIIDLVNNDLNNILNTEKKVRCR